MSDTITGRIFDIQSYSVNDGPGIRTLVFLKGCTLKCIWCSNPEGIHFFPQLRYIDQYCKKYCQECLKACPVSAIKIEKMKFYWTPSKCLNCNLFKCVKSCLTEALIVCGEDITSSELVKVIQKDISFFGKEGGVTLSGGEPFAQPEFTQSVLIQCKGKGISTAVETAMNIPWEHIEMSIPFIDFFMFDLKIMDTENNKKFCGAGNERILDNIIKLVKMVRIPILPRIPIIPGINDDTSNIKAIGRFLKNIGLKNIQLIPYMNLGMDKYRQLGGEYLLSHISPPSSHRLKKIEKILNTHGIICR